MSEEPILERMEFDRFIIWRTKTPSEPEFYWRAKLNPRTSFLYSGSHKAGEDAAYPGWLTDVKFPTKEEAIAIMTEATAYHDEMRQAYATRLDGHNHAIDVINSAYRALKS